MKKKINANKAYKNIFYDSKNQPKLRKWLIKSGIKENELNEVESMMHITFMNSVLEYNHDKISFEKYTWIKFKHTLCNYYYRKKHIKKISMEVDIRDIEEYNYNEDYNLFLDIEAILKQLNNIQSLIFKLILHNGLNKYEISNHCSISIKRYEEEINKMRIILIKYIGNK